MGITMGKIIGFAIVAMVGYGSVYQVWIADLPLREQLISIFGGLAFVFVVISIVCLIRGVNPLKLIKRELWDDKEE